VHTSGLPSSAAEEAGHTADRCQRVASALTLALTAWRIAASTLTLALTLTLTLVFTAWQLAASTVAVVLAA
jgi:hypothetical protein